MKSLNRAYFVNYYNLVNSDEYSAQVGKEATGINFKDESDFDSKKDIINKELSEKGWVKVSLNYEHTFEEFFNSLSKRIPTIHKDSGYEKTLFSKIEAKKDGKYFANTSLGQPLHMDDAHTDDPPRMIVLYCAKDTDKGGISTIVSLPEILSKLSLPIETFQNDAITLNGMKGKKSRPLFSELEDGKIGGAFPSILFNIDGRPEVIDLYQKIFSKIHNPVNQYRFRLRPGEIVLIDNFRAFHGRTKFSESSDRLLYRICFDAFEI